MYKYVATLGEMPLFFYTLFSIILSTSVFLYSLYYMRKRYVAGDDMFTGASLYICIVGSAFLSLQFLVYWAENLLVLVPSYIAYRVISMGKKNESE